MKDVLMFNIMSGIPDFLTATCLAFVFEEISRQLKWQA